MNKHIITKIREQLQGEEARLSTELDEVRAALKAIGVLGGKTTTAHGGVEANEKRRAAQKARYTDPVIRARAVEILAKARAARSASAAARRANGVDHAAAA